MVKPLSFYLRDCIELAASFVTGIRKRKRKNTEVITIKAQFSGNYVPLSGGDSFAGMLALIGSAETELFGEGLPVSWEAETLETGGR